MRNMVFTKMNGETLDIWETGTEPVLGAIELDFHRLFLVNKDTRIHARKEKKTSLLRFPVQRLHVLTTVFMFFSFLPICPVSKDRSCHQREVLSYHQR